MKPVRILFLGAPGSGKGTLTSRLLRRFDHIGSISSGDTLRAQIAKGTPIGVEADKNIKEGLLVPDHTMVGLITGQLGDQGWLKPASSWLLDGFPRTKNQAVELRKVLAPADADLNLVVELEVDQSVILRRIENRWMHLASGRVYNLEYNPPKVEGRDDVTGEPLEKRPDDNPQTFQKRLDSYNELLGPLKKFYSTHGILHTVAGNTSDAIYPQLERLVADKIN